MKSTYVFFFRVRPARLGRLKIMIGVAIQNAENAIKRKFNLKREQEGRKRKDVQRACFIFFFRPLTIRLRITRGPILDEN